MNAIAPDHSRYLDLLRGLAALTVALSHLVLFGIARADFSGWLPADGHDAVVLFFILSGYVIAASTQAKSGKGMTSYFLDRAARIASVAVPILFVAALFCGTGLIAFASMYQVEKWWLYIPFHLTFLSQSWDFREIPYGLNPWWSLPFEVWYYVLFGGLWFLRGKIRILFCLVVLGIMGPKLWVLLPIWFTGVWLYRSQIAFRISLNGARFLYVAGPVCYLLFMETDAQQIVRDIFLLPFGGWERHSLGYASYFGRDYVTTLFFLCHLIGAERLGMRLPSWIARFGASLASISFSLYLLHPVVYRTLSTLVMQPSANPVIVYGVAALAVAAAFALAPLTEFRRAAWRRLFERIIFAVSPRQRKSLQ